LNILYPNLYLPSVKEITEEVLNTNQIKGLILDVDNTLVDLDRNLIEGAKLWCENLKNKGISFCILSNTNKKDKVEKVSKELGMPYLYFAKKPFKEGFIKAKEMLNLDNKNIAVVGDQIFTDIVGANRVGMFSILVEPIDERDIWITKVKRPFEKLVINRYVKKGKNN